MRNSGVFLFAALSGATLWAQTTQTQTHGSVAVAITSSGPMEFNHITDNLERRTITGKPYSATAVTSSTQTLADGTHIARSVQASLARDSEGRTRREQNMDNVGPWNTANAKAPMVTIRDPVAQVQYVLQPDGQTAFKTPLAFAKAMLTVTWRSESADSEAQRAAEMRSQKVLDEVKARIAKAAVEGGNGGWAVVGDGERHAQVEDLGTKMIEGVNARGHRETQTIPAGQIGNDRAIQVVSETWYSDDLQAIVYSKRSDPRVGDSEYKLTNILRSEPARSLFEVPSNYTISDSSTERHRE